MYNACRLLFRCHIIRYSHGARYRVAVMAVFTCECPLASSSHHWVRRQLVTCFGAVCPGCWCSTSPVNIWGSRRMTERQTTCRPSACSTSAHTLWRTPAASFYSASRQTQTSGRVLRPTSGLLLPPTTYIPSKTCRLYCKVEIILHYLLNDFNIIDSFLPEACIPRERCTQLNNTKIYKMSL